MKPVPGSRADRAIAFIAAKGAARSSAIAEGLGIASSDVSALLAPYVEDGTLVTCKVEKPGTRSENEYRLGLAGGGHAMGSVPVAHSGGAPVVRRPTIDAPSRLHLDAEAARRRTASAPAAVEVPAAAPTESTQVSSPNPTPEPRDVVPVPETVPVAASAAGRFRVALASDATLILWIPGQTQPVDLQPEHTRALVDYLRKLDAISASIDAVGETPALLMRQAQ